MIYLDLDGVLCNFVDASLLEHGQDHLIQPGYPNTWSYYADWEITEDQFWEPIDKAGELFWVNLDPYPWLDEVLTAVELADPNFRICTAPSRHPTSLSGKWHWIQKYIGIGVDRVHMTTMKRDLSREGRLLIDDADHNYAAWQEHGGVCCLFPQPWNTNRKKDRNKQLRQYLDHYTKEKEKSNA